MLGKSRRECGTIPSYLVLLVLLEDRGQPASRHVCKKLVEVLEEFPSGLFAISELLGQYARPVEVAGTFEPHDEPLAEAVNLAGLIGKGACERVFESAEPLRDVSELVRADKHCRMSAEAIRLQKVQQFAH